MTSEGDKVNDVIGRISKHIYGHFQEHLGRGIYDGIWVGKDSEIDHIDGIRTDVLKALQALHIPVLRWPGAVSQTSITGQMV